MNGSRKGAVAVLGEVLDFHGGAVDVGAINANARNSVLAAAGCLWLDGYGKRKLIARSNVIGAIAHSDHRHVGRLGADGEVGGQAALGAAIPTERRNVSGRLRGGHDFSDVRVTVNVTPARGIHRIDVAIARSAKAGNDVVAVGLDKEDNVARLARRGVIVDGYCPRNLGERDV